jgi:DNA-binding CsgD family transcriptional regulator
MTTEKQRIATHPNSSGLGFLLLNGSFEPIYANDEAVQILAYPKRPRQVGALNGFLAEKIQSALFDSHSSPQSPPATEFLSGKRHYRCRAFSLDSHSTDPAHATAVLLERRPREAIDVAQIAAEFHLTGREQETVGLLVEGLTSKEIAGRMKISPHTVKAFIRLVMIKMGVSTRSGVIAKIIKTVL